MRTEWIIAAAAAALLLLVAWVTAADRENQWQFRTAYWAAKAHTLGKDPYDKAVLHELGGLSQARPGFFGPPWALYPYRAFLALDEQQAALVYLALKCLLIVALVALWGTAFLRDQWSAWFLPFTLLAFNSAACHDLISGDSQLIEWALLWAGFAAYVRGHNALFALCLLLAAVFQPVLLVFAFLLLDADERPWLFPILLGLALGAALTLGRRVMPELLLGYVRGLLSVPEEGWVNPAIWPLLQALLRYLSQIVGTPLPTWPTVVAYLLVVGVVLGISIRAAQGWSDLNPAARRTLRVYLACFVYALLAPHMHPASYLLLVVPVFHLLRRLPPLQAATVLAIVAVLPANPAAGLPFLVPVGVIVVQYYLWLCAALFWVLFCRHSRALAEGLGTVSESAAPPESAYPPGLA